MIFDMGLFRHMGFWGRGLVLLVALVLAACAPQTSIRPESSVAEPEAAAVWNAFESYSKAREMAYGPYRIRGSLRYGKEGDTRRVSLLFWSNGPLPIRLDVMAGVNSLVARILEAPELFVVYMPGEEKALVHEGNERVQLNFGKPVPFSLRDFSALMHGRFYDIFGSAEGIQPVRTPEGTLRFLLRGGLQQGELDLRSDGLPVRWAQPDGWIMDIKYDDEAIPLPYKIRLEHPDGYTAILLVKDREQPGTAFAAEQLELDLPPGTDVEPIRKLNRTR